MVTVIFRNDAGEMDQAWFETTDDMPDGMNWVRLIEDAPGSGGERRDCPFQVNVPNEVLVSRSIERHHPNAPRVDKFGRAIFSSRRELDEFIKKDPRYVNDGGCGDESHQRSCAEAQEEKKARRGRKLLNETTDETVARVGEGKVRRMKQKYDRLQASHKGA